MRYFAEIAFDGTDFSGWQVQPQKTTVQGEINRTLSMIFQNGINVVGCGRTDAGVHASQFFLHFDIEESLPNELLYKLNKMLPKSIVVKRIFEVETNQHSRFDAIRRSYTYHMHFDKDPFLDRYSSYCYHNNLDFAAMKSVAGALIKYKDFAAVSKANEDVKNSLCEVFYSHLHVSQTENKLAFQITANRFLHNMIRRIMGLLLAVGQNKISFKEVEEVFVKGGRFGLNFVAPPQGLFLSEVSYPFVHERK